MIVETTGKGRINQILINFEYVIEIQSTSHDLAFTKIASHPQTNKVETIIGCLN